MAMTSSFLSAAAAGRLVPQPITNDQREREKARDRFAVFIFMVVPRSSVLLFRLVDGHFWTGQLVATSVPGCHEVTGWKSASTGTRSNGRFGGAPCKGGVFQWVKAPPGECSSRKLPEQLWR